MSTPYEQLVVNRATGVSIRYSNFKDDQSLDHCKMVNRAYHSSDEDIVVGDFKEGDIIVALSVRMNQHEPKKNTWSTQYYRTFMLRVFAKTNSEAFKAANKYLDEHPELIKTIPQGE